MALDTDSGFGVASQVQGSCLSVITGYSPTPSQVIDGHFLDQGRLLKVLRDIFGASDAGESKFRVELRLNRYKIYPSTTYTQPPELTQEQILGCRTIFC